MKERSQCIIECIFRGQNAPKRVYRGKFLDATNVDYSYGNIVQVKYDVLVSVFLTSIFPTTLRH